ncbi:MAG: proprotein convertase P-domain-containing protein [Planctomycetota bacterium]
MRVLFAAQLLIILILATSANAQPANDNCVGALPALEGLNAFNITSATDSAVPADGSACFGTLLGGLHHDLWWTWTAPESGILSVTTCGLAGFDTDLAIYSGACGALSLVACNGDYSGCAGFTSQVLNLPITGGAEMLIRIGGWQPTSLGSGQFLLEFAVTPTTTNDTCATALAVASGSIPFNTLSATDGSEPFDPGPCAPSYPGALVQDVWYAFVAPEIGALDVSTCDNANFDTSLAVYRGACGALEQLACNGDALGCAGFTSEIANIPVDAGETLLIRLGGWQTGSAGTGVLSIEFHPSVIDAFSVSSVPGSGSITVEWSAGADLSSAAIAVDGVSYWVSGAITEGELINATLTGFAWPASVEVCVTAEAASGSSAPACAFVDVIAVPSEVITGVPMPLADSAITSSSAFAISVTPPADLRVHIDIAHPRLADLKLTLYSPEGDSVVLHSSGQAGTNGLSATYWQAAAANGPPFDVGRSMRPAGPGTLPGLGTSSPAGAWILAIEDTVAGETGALNGWTLELFDVPAADLPAPDLFAADHTQMLQLGRVGDEVGLMLQSVCCNQGEAPLDWHGNPDTRHPFMVFNLYRMTNERITQIGASWSKHAPGPATTADACGFGCVPPADPYTLGVGCSDIYSAGFNGIQTNLGPRTEIDPFTGAYNYGTSVLSQPPPSFNAIERRLRVRDVDLDPATNPSSTAVVEALYIAADDPQFSDNVTSEPIGITGAPGGIWNFNLSTPGTPTPAIFAWPGAQFSEVTPADASDGRCWLASKAFELPGGGWRYEYALWNHNFARRVGAFRVPVAPGIGISDLTFHAPWIETVVFDNEPWEVNSSSAEIEWSTATNPLRWGYLYGFGFTTDAPPIASLVDVVGDAIPDAIAVAAVAPAPAAATLFRRGDCNADGVLNVADPVTLLTRLFAGGAEPPCLNGCDSNDDGALDIADAVALLSGLFSGGPPPPPPHPDCGVDATASALGCLSSPACP